MRPRLILLAFLLGAVLAPAAAGQPAEAVRAFEVGNARYAEGDYAGALTAWEGAREAGYVSGALLYNMGNAYYRLDDVGRAVLFYERARLLLPDQPELAHNLEMARARTEDRFARLPPPVWTRAWRGVVRAVGAGGLFGAGLALYLAAAALASVRVLRGPRGAWHRRALAVSAVLATVLLGAAFAASLDGRLGRAAVVLAPAAPLRDAPDPAAEASLDVHEGAVVDVVRDEGAWIEVRLPDGTRGWLPADAAEAV